MENYRLTLLELYEERRASNTAYSIRAFARHCGVSPATLSQVMIGKRPLTVKSARKISERLALSPSKSSQLVMEKKTRETFGSKAQMDEDRFRLLADWYHYAILSLAELPKQSAEPAWIAERLGISLQESKNALERLKKCGMLEIKKGKLKRVSKPLISTQDVPSLAIRNHHRQILSRASEALGTIDVHFREFGAMTLTVDPSKISQVKRLMRRFRQEVAAIAESGNPKMVYHLSTQFFPVSLPEKFLSEKEMGDVAKE